MSTTTEKQDAWAEYFWKHPVDASLEEKLNRIAQIEEIWLRVDSKCSDYFSHGSRPDGPQSAGKLEEDKVEDAITNTDGPDEHQSQGKGFMLESHTPINEVSDEKPVTLNKRKLDTNGNLIPLPPATPPREASNCQALPSVIEKKVTVFAGPAGASSPDTTPSAVTQQGTFISPEDHLHSTNESPREPYRIWKAWEAAEAANRSIGVEGSPLDAPVIEGTVNSSGRYKTQNVSGEGRQSEEDLESIEHADLGLKNTTDRSVGVESRPQDAPITEGESRQSEEDLECVEHADLGLKNTTEAANGSIGVESSPQDGPFTEGQINSSGEYETPNYSGEDRQSEENLECVEHADLGLKNTAEPANGPIGVESSPRDALITDGEVNSAGKSKAQGGSIENRQQSEQDLESVEHADQGLKNSSEKPDGGAENEVPETDEIITGDIVNGDGGSEGPDVDEGKMEAQHPNEDSIDKQEKPDKSLDIEIGNMDARQAREDSINEKEEPTDEVESDVPVSDGIAEEVDETIGTGVLDVQGDDLNVEEEETEPQHPVKADIADEVGPLRIFFSRGLALYMEARGFVEPGVEAMGGEGPGVDHGQNAVEPLTRKDMSFIEWGLVLLLEAMDGSIGV